MNMKKQFNEQQIIAILKEAAAGIPARELCRKHGISDATFYTWRKNTQDWMSLKPSPRERSTQKAPGGGAGGCRST